MTCVHRIETCFKSKLLIALRSLFCYVQISVPRNTSREKTIYRDYAKPVKQNLSSRLTVEVVRSSETQTAQCHIPEDCTAMKIKYLPPIPQNTPNFIKICCIV